MQSTVFGENIFSNESQELFNSAIEHIPERKLLSEIDDYDNATGFHVRGVAQITAEFAVSGIVPYTAEQKQNLVRAAALHNIGKMSVLNTILNKAGVLNKSDWRHIERHPVDGFHQCANIFNPADSLPVLLHHTLQNKSYPSRKAQEAAISFYDLTTETLDNEETLINTIMIAVADHLESRYPITNHSVRIGGIRQYNDRQYSVHNLPLLVEASFVEAGKIHSLKLDWLLAKLIAYSREILT